MPRIDTPKWVGWINRAEPAAGIAQGPEGLPRSSTQRWLVRAPGGMLENCQTKRSWEGRVFFFPLPSVKYIYLKHHPIASVKFSDWRGRIDRPWQHVGGNTQREGTQTLLRFTPWLAPCHYRGLGRQLAFLWQLLHWKWCLLFSVDVKDALLMFLIKATASFLITKRNLWLCKWTSEIHTDYGDCTNWKYQREVDCLLPIYIRKIIFTLCISISLSSQKLLCSSWRPGWESIDTQRLQVTVHKPLKGMGVWPVL